MYKILLPLIIVLYLGGCSHKSIDYNKEPQLKAFDEEDEYIMYALESQLQGDLNASAFYYSKLYEKSHKNEYLYNQLQLMLASNRIDETINLLNRLIEEDRTHYELYRFKIKAYLQKNELENAKKLSLELLKQTQEEIDFLLVADTYLIEKNYNMAFKYLTRAYTINFNEDILDKLSIIMYVNLKMKSEAISQLESHILMRGCSLKICKRLLSYYGETNNVDAMLRIATKLYQHENDPAVGKIVVDIYKYKKDVKNLKSFLEETHFDDDLLMQIYASSKEYKKASQTAMKLYDKTSSIEYLAKAAIFSYENNSNDNKTLHNFVIKNLKSVIQDDPQPLYLNYLGYIMIEHDIEVEKGMEYVKEALKTAPKSPYYLDSLAWGYYKMRSCDKAYKIIKEVEKIMGSSKDKDVTKHIKAIKECLKKEKE